MGRIAVETDRLYLEIDPALGAGIADFSLKQGDALRALMRRSPLRPVGFNDLSCYLLAPWPNRIAGAQFSWRGRRYPLRPDWPDGTAIHGLVKDRPWRLVERSPVTAILEFDSRDHADLTFPWPFAARARYELSALLLSIRLSIRNAGPDPMPAGLGFHPFFPRTLGDARDEVAVQYAARGRYPATSMIPTAPAQPDDVTMHLASGRPLARLALDDVFLGSSDRATIIWPASGVRLTYACSSTLTHAVIYSGRPDSFCFEPVTMVNDGFNLASHAWPDTGVTELDPGEALTAEWRLSVDTL